VTLAGTLATTVFELARETVTPPLPAAVVRLTVPVPVRPLVMVLGLMVMLLSAAGAGSTVTAKVALMPE
jgi:hypothetical protein